MFKLIIDKLPNRSDLNLSVTKKENPKYYTNGILAPMDRFAIIWKYIIYRFSAKTEYDIHSPFIFDLIEHVLHDKRDYYIFEEIEELRKQLLLIDTELQVEDFGAGSRKSNLPKRRISAIAKNTLITPKFGKLLFHLAEHYQCTRILELGTSLGISTMYLAGASANSQIITLEGSPEIASCASRNFEKLHCNNIRIITGEFSQTLPEALRILEKTDLAFIDGNHRKQPTIDYFEQILPSCHEHSILVFDDIHWSREMEEAWNHIKVHPKVMLSVDLFFKGILFFNKDLHQKTDLTLLF